VPISHLISDVVKIMKLSDYLKPILVVESPPSDVVMMVKHQKNLKEINVESPVV
jgi:hypothetical protein